MTRNPNFSHIKSGSIASIHLNAHRYDVSDTAIVTTDLNLAKAISLRMQYSYVINSARGQTGYSGYYNNKFISVFSLGMGIFPSHLFSEALFNEYDVQTIIKCDTCLGLNNPINGYQLKLGDDVVIKSSSFSKRLSEEMGYANTVYYASTDLLNKSQVMFNIPQSKSLCVLKFITDVSSLHDYNTIEVESTSLYYNAQKYNKRAIAILKVSDMPGDEFLSASQRSYEMGSCIDKVFQLCI